MPVTDAQLSLIQTAFRPHAPIDDAAAFFGRDLERDRVQEAVSEAGLHVVVYGAPGCGKTSLANVATKGVPRIKIFCQRSSDFGRLLRDTALELQKLDPERIVYDAARDTLTRAGVVLPLANMSGNTLLSLLPSDARFCVIFDELDRVGDEKAIEGIAELVKNVATNRPNVTFIMVGVAETAGDVLKGHASNFRNIREVQLDRMSEEGLRRIVSHGAQVLGMPFSEEVTAAIVQLCDGMPYYLHLLAKHAARAAIDVGSPVVELDDLYKGAINAADDADQQLRSAYDHAILSPKGTRIYQRILWAMANLEVAANNVAAISAETNRIALEQADPAVTPQAIGGALRLLASDSKRAIVYQPIPGVYRFRSPLMKGFIRLVRYRR
jgi:uncharacterized protein